ncbi:MAG: hypothetical protein F9K18_01810 [Thermoanaerobaculia bacterium]|nr:MAG: hypothetical protein F9K18_01810 [Thermoanaerobaculia bacterium]
MTIRSMLRKGIVGAAAAAALLGLAAAPAGAQTDFGVRAGAYLEDADPFVGLELLTRMGSSEWFFNPNVEFVFADERDRISGNFDFHYDFRVTGDYYLWAGGGPAVIFTDGDGRRDSETDAGLNLLGGIGWRLSNLTPYAQAKVVISDDSEFVAAVGIRF